MYLSEEIFEYFRLREESVLWQMALNVEIIY